MKKIPSASPRGFEKHNRATRKAEFLARMESLMPWAEVCALIEPHYPKAGNGHPPVGLERMLRMYCVAAWFNLADEACEDALYDVPVFREFCRFDLGRERIPDATTLLNFHHLLEDHGLGVAMFDKIGEFLLANGIKLSGGTIADATLIAAPPSTKSQEKSHDPQMHQTKKGNKWHFGMKRRIGADSHTGLVHSASVTAANVHDSHQVPHLLHAEESVASRSLSFALLCRSGDDFSHRVGMTFALNAPTHRRRGIAALAVDAGDEPVPLSRRVHHATHVRRRPDEVAAVQSPVTQ